MKLRPIPRHVEQGLAEVEHALHAQAELADGVGIAGLASDAEGTKVLSVALLELAVVEEPEAGALQQRMRRVRVREAGMPPEDQRPRLGVVGVLDQLLEDREAVVVTIPKVVGNQIDVIGLEPLHHPIQPLSGRLCIQCRIRWGWGRRSRILAEAGPPPGTTVHTVRRSRPECGAALQPTV